MNSKAKWISLEKKILQIKKIHEKDHTVKIKTTAISYNKQTNCQVFSPSRSLLSMIHVFLGTTDSNVPSTDTVLRTALLKGIRARWEGVAIFKWHVLSIPMTNKVIDPPIARQSRGSDASPRVRKAHLRFRCDTSAYRVFPSSQSNAFETQFYIHSHSWFHIRVF